MRQDRRKKKGIVKILIKGSSLSIQIDVKIWMRFSVSFLFWKNGDNRFSRGGKKENTKTGLGCSLQFVENNNEQKKPIIIKVRSTLLNQYFPIFNKCTNS